METNREDFGIAIRSAFLKRGVQQRFSLFALVVLSVILIFLDTIETKPLNGMRSFVKDVIYRGAAISSYPSKSFSSIYNFVLIFVWKGIKSFLVFIAITISSSAALPALSPIPFIVHSTCLAPATTPAKEFATARPKSL